MEESILNATKKKLNVSADDTSFDLDIIDHINTAFSHLHQLGIGPSDGFQIEGADAVWSDFVDGPIYVVNAVKNNVYLRVRLIFDPPSLASVLTSLERMLDESNGRLLIMREETDWVDPDPQPATDQVNTREIVSTFTEVVGE